MNHYYLVCIGAAERTDENAQTLIESYLLLGQREKILEYKGEVGDYAELSDSYSFKEDSSDIFSIGKINKALKEYWEDMGF